MPMKTKTVTTTGGNQETLLEGPSGTEAPSGVTSRCDEEERVTL